MLFVKNVVCNKMSNIAMKSIVESIEKSRKSAIIEKSNYF